MGSPHSHCGMASMRSAGRGLSNPRGSRAVNYMAVSREENSKITCVPQHTSRPRAKQATATASRPSRTAGLPRRRNSVPQRRGPARRGAANPLDATLRILEPEYRVNTIAPAQLSSVRALCALEGAMILPSRALTAVAVSGGRLNVLCARD